MTIGVLVCLVQWLGCAVCFCGVLVVLLENFFLLYGEFLVLFCTVLVGVWAQVAPVGWSFLLLYGVGAVFVLRSQPGISRLEGRVVTGRCFVCCPGFPLPALDFSLGFFVSRQGSLLAFTVGDYMHLTLYWPYCRSFRVEGFAPRNPTFAWVSVVLSRCRWLRC